MATKEGMVKKTPYGRVRQCTQKRTSGYCTERGDELIEVKATDDKQDSFPGNQEGNVHPL